MNYPKLLIALFSVVVHAGIGLLSFLLINWIVGSMALIIAISAIWTASLIYSLITILKQKI